MRHDSDVFFREWGSELSAKFALAGLVQTADTGQINWTTVVRAGTNADAGYEIWRMNDAAQATAPVFFRIDYGTGTTLTSPRIQLTVGTSTSGAGVIGGIASVAWSLGNYGTGANTDTARQSYLCVVSGFFGLSWKTGAAQESIFFFCRTVDADGAATVTGALAWWGGTATNASVSQSFRYAATAQAFASRTGPLNYQICLLPQTPAGSLVDADNQAYLWWTITPQVSPLVGACGVFATEVSAGSTFAATLVGVTSRTYIGLTTLRSPEPSNTLKPAMLWE